MTMFAAINITKRSLTSAALLAGLLLIDGQLGSLTFALRRVTAAALAATVVASLARPKFTAKSAASLVALGATAIAPTVGLAALAYVVALTLLVEHDDSCEPSLPLGLPAGGLTYLGVGFCADLFPPSRAVGDFVCDAAYSYLRVATGAKHRLGPTALGSSTAALAVLYLLWQWRLRGSVVRLIAAALLPPVWFAMLPICLPAPPADPQDVFLRGACSGLACIALAAAIDAVAPLKTLRSASTGGEMPRTAAIVIGGVGVLVGLTLVATVNPLAPATQSILVHNRGGLDWERPMFGKFGAFSGGMFGLLPVYARGNGYRFEVLDNDTIHAADLKGFQTLVLINSPKRWAGEELRTVREFVANGGGLLVLGDHTDVFGLMKGFNSLLEPFGIAFQFDSAYFARSTWRGCLACAPDAVTYGWENEGPGTAIGASLKLRGWSRPLLVGRYAHSDLGVRANVVGSYLGNYHYDHGERLGDVILMASAAYGRGRVIVLGDTSPFQGGLSYSFPRAVGPLLNLLARPTSVFERPPCRALATGILFAALFVLWAKAGDKRCVAVLALALLMGMAGGLAVSHAKLKAPIVVDKDCFLVDKSHLPAVGHYAARVNPSTLETNLLRCGLRVADQATWDAGALAKSKGVAFIAPRRSFNPGEIADLLRFEESGGIVLLAVSHPDLPPSRPLLLAHGLDMEARPLGTVPTRTAAEAGVRERERPRFLDAWPIVSASAAPLADIEGVETLFRAGDDVTALFAARGRGGLLLFSDSRFFSTMNVEDVSGHWVGNLALIHDVFRKYLHVQPHAVRPLFRSPKKPE